MRVRVTTVSGSFTKAQSLNPRASKKNRQKPPPGPQESEVNVEAVSANVAWRHRTLHHELAAASSFKPLHFPLLATNEHL